MTLHDGRRPLGADLPFDELSDGLGLALAGGDEDQLAGLHDGGQPLGDALGGHRLDVAAEEAGVVPAGLLVELAQVCARVEGAAGLVEPDVPVGADAEDLQVAVSGGSHLGLVVPAGGLEVLAQRVRAVEGPGAHVDAGAQIGLHEGGIALRVPGGKADVLVEHESGDLREAEAPGGATSGELVIQGQGRGSCRGAQHGCRFVLEQRLDLVGGPLRDRLRGIQNDKLHDDVLSDTTTGSTEFTDLREPLHA